MGGWTSIDGITAYKHGLLYEARQTVQPIKASLQGVQKSAKKLSRPAGTGTAHNMELLHL